MARLFVDGLAEHRKGEVEERVRAGDSRRKRKGAILSDIEDHSATSPA